MSALPTLGEAPKRSVVGPAVAAAVLVAALTGGVLYFRARSAPSSDPVSAALPAADAGPVALPPPPPPPTPEEQLKKAGLKRLSIRINGPLETGVIGGAGHETGPALTQVLTRTLVWWVHVPGDLVRGDTLDALYQERPGDEPVVHAVRFTSQKHDKTYAAYRFKAGGDTFSRFYGPLGDELELRLADAPVDGYDQITSLLKDGRRHKGVDFKTPVGTPVKATFDGTVSRKLWSFRGNGNCFQVTEAGGQHRSALYLHLSELPEDLKVGRKVKKGEVLASSGNTGHSFAPHLHYQLVSAGGAVLDPFESQPSSHRALEASQLPAFEAEERRLDGLMPATTAPIP